MRSYGKISNVYTFVGEFHLHGVDGIKQFMHIWGILNVIERRLLIDREGTQIVFLCSIKRWLATWFILQSRFILIITFNG
jgi:hypothetical protein